MSRKFPVFVDAENMAQDLANNPIYRRLNSAIRKVSLHQACLSDLSQARDVCAALHNLLASPRKRGTMERGVTEGALLMGAVLFYARATSTSGSRGERGSVQVASKLTEVQQGDHQALIATRNRALAHVYSRELVGDDIWHRDRLFFVMTEQGWKPGSATRTIQYSKATFERLQRQVPVAHDIIYASFLKHMDSLTAILNKNPAPLAAFQKNEFDPVSFFGTEADVRNALSGLSSGNASFLSQ